jgi:hypothetical protein
MLLKTGLRCLLPATRLRVVQLAGAVDHRRGDQRRRCLHPRFIQSHGEFIVQVTHMYIHTYVKARLHNTYVYGYLLGIVESCTMSDAVVSQQPASKVSLTHNAVCCPTTTLGSSIILLYIRQCPISYENVQP